MIKKAGFLILIFIFSISCSSSDDTAITKRNEFSQFIVHPNSELKVAETENGTYVELIEGDKIVFEYIYTILSDPQIADSGYNEYFYFQVDEGTEDFQLTSEDMVSSSAYLRLSCFCRYTDFRPITSGEINAEKIGNLRWDINFEVESEIEENGEIVETIDMRNFGIFKPE